MRNTRFGKQGGFVPPTELCRPTTRSRQALLDIIAATNGNNLRAQLKVDNIVAKMLRVSGVVAEMYE